MNDALARERYLKTGMGKRYLKKRMRRFLSLTGQALLELAIFGSILIMLLGILVNYGLRYNFQQQVMQQAFRKALKSAADAVSPPPISGSLGGIIEWAPGIAANSLNSGRPFSGPPGTIGGTIGGVIGDVIGDVIGGVIGGTIGEVIGGAIENAVEPLNSDTPISDSQVVIQDRHIPDPANPFGIGSIMPISASASVTRNYKLQETPDNKDELPVVTLNISGRPPLRFKTAGFREESNLPEESIGKYKEIYGSTNVWETGNAECVKWKTHPLTGEKKCVKWNKNIKIIDSAVGEIISYDAVVRQCRQIVDKEAFKKECERGKYPGSTTDCNSLASQPMNVPWYCRDAVEINPTTHQYTFPVLDQFFNFAIAQNKPKTMGLQQDYTQTTSMNNALKKQETHSGITTTDTLGWQVDTKRTIVYHPYNDTSPSTTQEEVTSSVSQHKTKEWTTRW